MAQKNQPSASYAGKAKTSFNGRLATTAAGIALATGALTYVSVNSPSSVPPVSTLSPAETPSPFLSMDEAIDIYRQLEKQVKEKWEEAQRENKPLRIVILEQHGSKNALAYEMMLTDIAARLGIKTLALEQSEEVQKDSLRDPVDWNYPYRAPSQILLRKGVKSGMQPLAIDNRYANIAEEDAFWDVKTAEIAEAALKSYLRMPGVRVSVTADPDPASSEFSYHIEGLSKKIEEAQVGEVGNIMSRARNEAFDVVREERNAYMVSVLEKAESAVVVTGKKHGNGILSALRDSGDIDMAVSISLNTEKHNDQQYLASGASERDKDLLRWANDPNNVKQYEGKDFNPETLPIFVEHVIEKANSRGARGP